MAQSEPYIAFLRNMKDADISEFARELARGESMTKAAKTAIPGLADIVDSLPQRKRPGFFKAFGTNPRVAMVIDISRERAVKKSGIDAAWVLKQAEMLFNKCIADDDNVTAKHTLELIGKHKFVDAFASKKIDMTTQGKPMAVEFNITFAEPSKAEIAAADLSREPIEHEPDTQALEHQEAELLEVDIEHNAHEVPNYHPA